MKRILAHMHHAYSKLKKTIGIIAWLTAIPRIPDKSNNEDRRMLMIYDLSSQPFNIGDFLILQEVSFAQCKRFNLSSVDVAIVYEPKHPGLAIPEFSSITEDNVLYHLSSILPVAQVNQNLGSLFIFNSHLQLERYITENAATYQMWPSALQYVSKEYSYYRALNDVLYDYFKDYVNIPHLRCRQFLVEWASEFYRNNLCSCIPVTVNLRNNKLFGTHRNSIMDCWLNFFKHCSGRYPVKFIVICALHEIDERMRHLDNVIIAKDFHTSIEHDLTLISTSAIHMGASSGPFSMAWFGDKPYLMFNWSADPKDYKCLIEDNGFYRFIFSAPFQRMTKEPETTELLIKEFGAIWGSIDHSKYEINNYSASNIQKEPLTWLR